MIPEQAQLPDDLAGEAIKRIKSRTGHVPFPVDFFPGCFGAYVKAAASDLDAELASVAVPMLGVVGGMIGSRWWIKLSHRKGRGYRQPAYIWSAVVANSGENKSGAFDAANELATNLNKKLIDQSHTALSDYEKTLEQWKAEPPATRGEKPQAPRKRRCRAGDITYESLVTLCKDNPHGPLISNDEISNFFGSLHRYKAKGQQGDGARYLEAWNGTSLSYDRKDGSSCTVERSGVSITGTIQPSTLRAVIGEAEMSSGMLTRWLFTMPPSKPRLVKADITDTAGHEFIACITALGSILNCEFETDYRYCIPERETMLRWIRWQHELSARTNEEADPLIRLLYPKIEAYSLRFALIRHILGHSYPDRLCSPSMETVSLEDIEWGIALAEWFLVENKRVYAESLDLPGKSVTDSMVDLNDWIMRVTVLMPGTFARGVTLRDICRKFRTDVGTAKTWTDELLAAGLIEEHEVPHPTIPHMPPTTYFRALVRQDGMEDFDPEERDNSDTTNFSP